MHNLYYLQLQLPTTTITNEPVITPVSGLPTSIVTPPLRPLYKESLDEKALREATARVDTERFRYFKSNSKRRANKKRCL